MICQARTPDVYPYVLLADKVLLAINNSRSLKYPLFMDAVQVRRNTNKQRCHNRSQFVSLCLIVVMLG